MSPPEVVRSKWFFMVTCPAFMWRWQTVLRHCWKELQHVNVLEVWHGSHLVNFRFVNITDSQVMYHVLTTGRSSSLRLNEPGCCLASMGNFKVELCRAWQSAISVDESCRGIGVWKMWASNLGRCGYIGWTFHFSLAIWICVVLAHLRPLQNWIRLWPIISTIYLKNKKVSHEQAGSWVAGNVLPESGQQWYTSWSRFVLPPLPKIVKADVGLCLSQKWLHLRPCRYNLGGICRDAPRQWIFVFATVRCAPGPWGGY